MAEATGHGGGELMPLRPGDDTALDAWLSEQAQTIEREHEALTRARETE